MNALNNNKIIFTEYYLKLIYFTIDLLETFPEKETEALIADTKLNIYKGLQNLMYANNEKKISTKIRYLKRTLKFICYQEKLIDLAYNNKFVSYSNYKKHCDITNILNQKINYIIQSLHISNTQKQKKINFTYSSLNTL